MAKAPCTFIQVDKIFLFWIFQDEEYRLSIEVLFYFLMIHLFANLKLPEYSGSTQNGACEGCFFLKSNVGRFDFSCALCTFLFL